MNKSPKSTIVTGAILCYSTAICEISSGDIISHNHELRSCSLAYPESSDIQIALRDYNNGDKVPYYESMRVEYK